MFYITSHLKKNVIQLMILCFYGGNLLDCYTT
jgi:hypothetical protein